MTTEESLYAVRGPAFPLCARILVTGIVCAVLAAAVWIGDRLITPQPNSAAIIATAAAILALQWCLYWIWCAETSVDDRGIHQTGLAKPVDWADLAEARLITYPRLSWILGARLVASQQRAPRIVSIRVGDARVLAGIAARLPLHATPAKEDSRP